MSDTVQQAYTRARQRAADARHNAEEYASRAKTAEALAEQLEREVRHMAKSAWAHHRQLKVQPLKTRKVGTIATAPRRDTRVGRRRNPVLLIACDLCGHEFEGGSHCPECSEPVAGEEEAA